MFQLLAILVAFLILPLVIRRGVRLSLSILITTLTLGILSNMGLAKFARIIVGVFINSGSRDTILTIFLVGILGGLMKYYKLLDRIVDTMLNIINNKRTILMIIPPMMGMLIMPGGAALSAPFVNNMGEELKVAKPKRAAINLIFRHMAMFVLPYSTSLLLIRNTLPEINIYILIALNFLSVISIVTIGYIMFVKDIKSEKVVRDKNYGRDILKLMALTSPIYSSVILNALFNTPFYIGMIVSIFLVYLLSDKKDFLGTMIRSINREAFITIIAILILKDTILNMEDLLELINGIFLRVDSRLLTLAIFMLVSMFFGLITGNSSVPLAVNLPVLMMMNLPSNQIYVYLYFLFNIGFLGYYFSPIHLCQILTIQEIGISTMEIYKAYRRYAPVLTAVVLSITGLMFMMLN